MVPNCQPAAAGCVEGLGGAGTSSGEILRSMVALDIALHFKGGQEGKNHIFVKSIRRAYKRAELGWSLILRVNREFSPKENPRPIAAVIKVDLNVSRRFLEITLWNMSALDPHPTGTSHERDVYMGGQRVKHLLRSIQQYK